MLIFESTKTNTPIAPTRSQLILKSPPHTYVHNAGNDDHGNKRRWHSSKFKQKLTQISCVKQSKMNVTHLSGRNNWLFCSSDIFLFFFFHLSLSNQSANIHPVHSNWALSSLHHSKACPLLLIGYKCVLGHGPTLWSKVFLKHCLVHL